MRLCALTTTRGAPPHGKTAVVGDQHQTQPIVPPDKIARSIPQSLSEIVGKMVASARTERYSNMGEVIKALRMLGVTARRVLAQGRSAKSLETAPPPRGSTTPAMRRFADIFIAAYFIGKVLFVVAVAWFRTRFKWTGARWLRGATRSFTFGWSGVLAAHALLLNCAAWFSGTHRRLARLDCSRSFLHRRALMLGAAMGVARVCDRCRRGRVRGFIFSASI